MKSRAALIFFALRPLWCGFALYGQAPAESTDSSAAAARITSVSPKSGPPGTQVTISGSGFGAARDKGSVWLGSAAGLVVSWSATKIVASVAPNSVSGIVEVYQSGEWSNALPFTVTSAPTSTAAPSELPHITTLTPTSGTAGTQVTISGSGFGAVRGKGSVWLGSTLGNVVSWADAKIVATVARNSTSGVARVHQAGVWSNSVSFSVSTAAISTVTPTSGVPGGTVTITGSRFGESQGNGQVWLGSASGVVQSWSDTRIVALVDAAATSGKAQVLQNGVMSNAVAFDVNTLHISEVTPASGSPGIAVTITGAGFGSSGTVLMGGTEASLLAWSDTEVTAVVPTTALTGVVRILSGGQWSNAKAFTVPTTSGANLALAPNVINLTVGETHRIQAVVRKGQAAGGLTWKSSDPSVVRLSNDDPPVLSAMAPGHVTITGGTASADVTVAPRTLPGNTVIWSYSGDGSGVNSIVSAVPTINGLVDVFAFQADGIVDALTSDGNLAWSADASQAPVAMPDFQGGLILAKETNWPFLDSIVKLDGITGEPYAAFTPSSGASLWYSQQQIAIHPDGTIFAGLYNDPYQNSGSYEGTLVGIDPTTGAQKFSVPFVDPSSYVLAGPIVAGDGYAYVAYAYYDSDYVSQHLMVLRVSCSGEYDNITIQDFTPPNGNLSMFANLITNADTGVLLTFQAVVEDLMYRGPAKPPANGARRSPGKAALLPPSDWHRREEVDPSPEFGMAIVTGTSASLMSGPVVADQGMAVVPMLQAEDGSFVGAVWMDSAQYNMVDFDSSGNVLWTVANDQPLIATEGGGVIGQSGTTYDQSGNSTGQIANMPVQSITGNDYQIGSVEQVVFAPFLFASTFAAFQLGSPAQNGAYIPSLGARYRAQVATIAKGYVNNSTRWQETNRTPTCNIFVRDVLMEASSAVGTYIPFPALPHWYQSNYGHPFLAADWASPSLTGAGCWKPLPGGPNAASPGDVIATGYPAGGNDGTGHVGIIVSPNTGFPLYVTASAADYAPYFWTPEQRQGFIPGTITQTDYGFRLPGYNPNKPSDVQGLIQDSHVRRFSCY